MYVSFHLCLLLDWFHIQFLKLAKHSARYFLMQLHALDLEAEWKSLFWSQGWCSQCAFLHRTSIILKHPLNPPTWCILLSWSLHYPLWEEELPFSSVSEYPQEGSESVATTLSSVPSETLFGRASQNSAILLLTFPLLQAGLIIFNCIILWITSGSTLAFLLSHICPDLLTSFCFSFPPW